MGDLALEIVVGVALIVVGFVCLYVVVGEDAFAWSGEAAWVVGSLVVGVFGVGFLATREWLQRRRAKRR